MRRWRQLVFAFVAAAAVLGAAAPSGAQTITYVPIPTANADIAGFALGPDGNVWFTEKFANKIGVINGAGAITEFTIPTSNSFPSGIAAGSDGNLWFFESNPGNIGRITTAGVVTEFPTPNGAGNGFQGAGIAAGSDGALWFTEATAGLIGRITLNGTVSEFTIPTANASPRAIAAGPDGALWFTESGGNQIGRITTAGAITEFAVPTANSAPRGIAAGSDAALWFTEFSGNKIGRIAQDGMVTEFPVPTANSQPAGITSGPDGALWFAEQSGNNIGRITTDPTSSETQVQAGCTLTAVAFNSAGNLNFNCTNTSSPSNNVVGLVAPPTCETLTLTAPGFATPGAGGLIVLDPPYHTCGPSPNDQSLECKVGARCQFSFDLGDFVNVSPYPRKGSSFTGWGGDCSSTGTKLGCNLNMSAPRSASATFAVNPTVTLSVVVIGRGRVTSDPPGLDCGELFGLFAGQCTASFPADTLVTLTAAADADVGATFSGWGITCASSGNGTCLFQLASDVTVPASFVNPTSPVAAVLPVSQGSSAAALAARAAGAAGPQASFSTATVFATMINTAAVTATDCAIQPTPSFPGSFAYQTTDPATNALTGTANTPVSITAGAAQSFVIALTPDAPIAPTPLDFTFACANVGAAQIITDLNTLLFSASATSVPNIIALGATATNDQILHIKGTTGSNAFAVATFNLGSSDTVTVQPDTGAAALPLTLSVCETNPASGQCTSPIGPTVSTAIGPNATPTFALFATAQGAIPLYPQANRIFVRFFDSSGQPRGATSVAVVAQ
jgi:virginiamycin B lyase